MIYHPFDFQPEHLLLYYQFFNSFSFIFSPRPGTVAADLPLIEKKKSMERLDIVQERLLNNQKNMKKNIEATIKNVIIENEIDDK